MARVANDLGMSLNYASVLCSVADVLALFSSPKTIVPNKPGFWILPTWAWFEKSAGTPYTIGTATKLGLYLSTQIYLSAFTFPGFMDQANAITRFSRGPGTNTTELIAQDILDSPGSAPGAAPNTPLQVSNSVANLTAGTCTLRVTCFYRLIPVSPPWF